MGDKNTCTERSKYTFREEYSGRHSSVVLNNILDGCVPFEELFQKDLYEFSNKEFIQLLNKLEIDTPSSLATHKAIIQEYVEYRGGITENIKSVMLDDLYSSMPACFGSFEDFCLFDFTSYGGIPEVNDTYIMDRTFNFLTWYGFTNEEIYQIQKSDFDKDNLSLRSPRGYCVTLDPSTSRLVDLCFRSTSQKFKVRYGYKEVLYEKGPDESNPNLMRRVLSGVADTSKNTDKYRIYYFKRRWKKLIDGKRPYEKPRETLDYKDIMFSGAACDIFKLTNERNPKKIPKDLIINRMRINGGDNVKSQYVSIFRKRYQMWLKAFH